MAWSLIPLIYVVFLKNQLSNKTVKIILIRDYIIDLEQKHKCFLDIKYCFPFNQNKEFVIIDEPSYNHCYLSL